MSLALIVYLVFTALPAISKLALMGFGVWAFSSAVGLVVGAIEREIANNRQVWDSTVEKVVKGWYKAAIICLVVAHLIPTKEVTAYMLGAYGVQTIAENEKVQELGAEGLDVLQSLMKKAKAEIEEVDPSATPTEKAN